MGEYRLTLKVLWLKGRWHSVKRYEAVQPIRAKKGWVWVGEMVDQILKREGEALRRCDTSIKGVMGAVQRVVDEVRELKYGKENLKGQWSGPSDRKQKEKEIAVETPKSGVVFTSVVKPVSDGSSWFPTNAGGSSLFPVVPPIASGTIGNKSRRTYATEEEALKAAGFVKGVRKV